MESWQSTDNNLVSLLVMRLGPVYGIADVLVPQAHKLSHILLHLAANSCYYSFKDLISTV
jgi:hypothetical protein